MTEIATVEQQGSALILDSQQQFWNQHQIAGLTQLGVEKATQADLAVYMHVCQRTGLDPFARQIYMIERQGKQTIQTGIDGYRLVARRSVDRASETLRIGPVEWCGKDKVWTDVWLGDDGPPAAARITVYRNGEPFPAIALWHEYVQTFWKDGSEQVTKMWRTRGAGQLAKCAEALALRKAFPQDLSGIYVDAEFDRADVVQGETVKASPLDAALAAQRAPETSDPAPGNVVSPAEPPAESEPPVQGEQAGSEHDNEPVEAEIVETPAPESPLLNTSGPLAKNMFRLFGEIGLTQKGDRLAYVCDVIRRTVASSTEMTDADCESVIAAIEDDLRKGKGVKS